MSTSRTSVLEKITDKISALLTPLSEKLMSVQFISAISQTMQAVMPVILIGSIGCLIAYLDVGPWQDIVTSVPYLVSICDKLQLVTLGLFSLYVVTILTYVYATMLEMKENVACIPISVTVFLMFTPCSWDGVPTTWMGTSGLFSALIIGILVPRLVRWMIQKRICIRMPDTVPKFVEDSFKILIPGLIIAAAAGVINAVLENTSFECLHNVIYTIIQAPISNIGLSLPGHMLICVLAASVMWCGLHAGTIGNLLQPLLLAASADNLAAYTSGQEMPHLITQEFFNLTLPGMAGCLLIPAILMAFFCRSRQLKSVGRLAVVPAVFGIGEPVLFGAPVMLNALLFLPMIISIVVNNILAYGAMALDIVGRSTGVVLPWTTPPILYPLLSNSTPVRAAILNLLLILIDLVIWYPFVKAFDRNTCRQEEEKAKEYEK